MSEVLVLGESEVVEGFSLTGADVEGCQNAERAAWRIADILRLRSHGVVIVTETLYGDIPEKLRLKAEQSGRPLFVTLPRPAGQSAWAKREDLISRIIRRAIGYRLKIRR